MPRAGRSGQCVRRSGRPYYVTQRVGVEAITARGVEVDTLIEKFIDAAGAGR